MIYFVLKAVITLYFIFIFDNGVLRCLTILYEQASSRSNVRTLHKYFLRSVLSPRENRAENSGGLFFLKVKVKCIFPTIFETLYIWDTASLSNTFTLMLVFMLINKKIFAWIVIWKEFVVFIETTAVVLWMKALSIRFITTIIFYYFPVYLPKTCWLIQN